MRADLVAQRAGLQAQYNTLLDPTKSTGMDPEQAAYARESIRQDLAEIDTQLRAISAQRPGAAPSTGARPAPTQGGKAASRGDVQKALEEAKGDKAKAGEILRRRGFDLNAPTTD